MTLVLVHSAGATPAVWDGVRMHLGGIPVVAPPLPGRDGAGEPADTIEAHASAVLGAMDAAGIERATIAGHSLGGGVALWLALHHPARVAGLGLVSADLSACERFDALDRLWEIRCRTQVFVGSADVLTPPKHARALAERISAARLVEYVGAGHMLPVERPAEVAGELAVLWAAGLDGPVSLRPAGPSVAAEASSASRR